MAVGVLIAVVIGKDLEEEIFKKIMAVTIFISVIFIFWWVLRKNRSINDHHAFVALIGMS